MNTRGEWKASEGQLAGTPWEKGHRNKLQEAAGEGAIRPPLVCQSDAPPSELSKKARQARQPTRENCQELATLYTVGCWTICTKVVCACQPLSSCCQKRRETNRFSGQTGHRRRFFADRVPGVPALNCIKMSEMLRKEKKFLGSFASRSSNSRAVAAAFGRALLQVLVGLGGGVRCLVSVDTV